MPLVFSLKCISNAYKISRVELMIAQTPMRRQGYGRATVLTFLRYIHKHLDEILAEYKKKESVEKMSLVQLKVKIGSKNEQSIKLFESVGFIEVEVGPNYFGEIELLFEGFLGEERTRLLLEKYAVEGYREIPYSQSRH